MIVLKNLTKIYSMRGQHEVVADNMNATFPTGASVGLLGRNGAGKSTLLKLIAGTTSPTWGEVLSSGSVSFPVGLASSLHPDLTGAQNARFVARIYGADTDALIDYVQNFAELGAHFHLPVRSYSSGMNARLGFGINMGLNFDTYLVDEVTAVGDASFKKKSRDVFLQRMERSGAIFVSHSMPMIRELCDSGALLEKGKLIYFEDVEEAIDRYMFSLSGSHSYVPDVLPDGAADMDFPREARMLFGLGVAETNQSWLGDCLRRHRPCHFGKEREPHYFDIRAGLAPDVFERRLRSARNLTSRMGDETGDIRANTARLLGEVSNLLTMHTAPYDGPDRHNAYLDYVLTGRKTQTVICDFTPDYALLGEDHLAEMATIGRAHFAVLLRDPATRLWAEILSRLPGRNRTAAAATKVAETLLAQEDPSSRVLKEYPQSDYIGLLTRLESAVRPERIFCFFHETLMDGQSLETLCERLDIPSVPKVSLPPEPEDSMPPLPEGLHVSLRQILAPQYDAMKTRFGQELPPHWEHAVPHATEVTADG